MPRGLDHIVHAVADLDAAAQFYRRCGFHVGARNRHPWGTHNHVVQLPGFFIEVLTVAEPDKLGDDGLSRHFGAFQRDAISRGDGFSMLVVESRDIDGDAADFQAHGIGTSPALAFARQATMPDGSNASVGFSLAFARDANAPRVGFAACRQANPEAFWNEAYQDHANGAAFVAGIVLVAADPAKHLGFLQALTGSDQVESRLDEVILHTPRGDVEVQRPAAFGERTGNVPDCGEGAVLAALRIAVDDLGKPEHALRTAGLPVHRRGASLAVAPQAAYGATIIFEQIEGN